MGHVLARKACIVVPTPAESCVARASKSKLSPAHVRRPPSRGPQLNWDVVRHVTHVRSSGLVALLPTTSTSSGFKMRRTRACVTILQVAPFGVGLLGLGKVNCHVHLPPSR